MVERDSADNYACRQKYPYEETVAFFKKYVLKINLRGKVTLV